MIGYVRMPAALAAPSCHCCRCAAMAAGLGSNHASVAFAPNENRPPTLTALMAPLPAPCRMKCADSDALPMTHAITVFGGALWRRSSAFSGTEDPASLPYGGRNAATRCTKVCECPPNDTPLSAQRFFERTKDGAKAKGAAALTEHARLALSIQEHLGALSAVQPQRPSALQRCVPAVHGFRLRQSPGPIQNIVHGRERVAPRPSELFALLRAKVQQLL